MLFQDWCLLPSEESSAREVLLNRDVLGGKNAGFECGCEMALERASRLHVRWDDGHHARHSRKPSILSATLQSEAGAWLSCREDRRHHFTFLRSVLDLGLRLGSDAASTNNWQKIGHI